MEFAIDKGLGAEHTKLGVDGKTQGYKVGRSRLKAFLTLVCACGFILIAAMGYYNRKAVMEQFKSMQATKKKTKSQSESIRLGMYLQSQLHEQHHAKEVEKTFLRINRFAERQFGELETILQTQPITLEQVQEVKQEVNRFITQELEDFRDDIDLMNDFTKKRQQKVLRMQEKALQQLLKDSSPERLSALAEMLEQLFEDVENTPDVQIPPTVIPTVDDLVEMLFGEELSFEGGVTAWNELVKKHNIVIPDKLQRSVLNAMKGENSRRQRDILGDSIATVVEAARLSAGRQETLALSKQWESQKSDSAETTGGVKYTTEDARVLVEIAIEVQRLITAGKVPAESFDFEELELESFADDSYEGAADFADEES